MNKRKVIVVEDELLIRKQLISILEKLDYEVIASYSNGDHFLDNLSSYHPDIILFDINIKGSKDGIVLAQIVRDKYEFPFVFVTSYADKATLEAAKQTRPNGYIVKPFDERDIMSTLEIALFNVDQQRQRRNLSKERIEHLNKIKLTEKEFATLGDLVKGLSNAQIAAHQEVSINTVKTHLKNLYAKFQVNDRVKLVRQVLDV